MSLEGTRFGKERSKAKVDIYISNTAERKIAVVIGRYKIKEVEEK